MFEKALKQRLRFKIDTGVVSTEDLWQLPLPTLDSLAKSLNKALQEQEISFISDVSEANTKLQLQFDIVKHVIATKLAERDALKDQAEKLKRRKVILAALADKQDANLRSMSEEDLRKELESLS